MVEEIKNHSHEVKVESAHVAAPVSPVKEKGSLAKMRENPWMVSTLVLVLVLIGFIVFGGSSGGSGDVVTEKVASDNLISFIKSQSNGQPVDVNVLSSVKDGSLYKVTLDYQGQNIPVFVSLDGKYLIADPIPLSGLPANTGNTGNTDGTSNTGEPVNVDLGDSPFKGKDNAPVTIVEFSDFQCPFCGKFFTETYPSIIKDYVDTGKVKFVYKDFPLSNLHPEAQKAAEAARCVEEQKGAVGFFKMHDKLYANQETLSVENYKKWAKEIGVDQGKFDTCLDSGKYADAVKADLAYGQQLGVSGTPSFFINGKMLTGAQPYSVFKQAIDAELAAVGSSTSTVDSGAPAAIANISADSNQASN